MAKKALSKRIRELCKKAFGENQKALAGYRDLREKVPLNQFCILLESQQGRTANGNLFYIAEELCLNPLYRDFNIYFVTKERNSEAVQDLFRGHGIDRLRYVVINSPEYIRLLASSKYLVTDTSFPTYFVKREGQVVWNTWHGTPLKAMGRKDTQSLHDLGNVQKNFALADYLSYPNRYTLEHMKEDYMLENLAHGSTVICGYPRNTAFFDPNKSKAIREELSIESKRVYAYMPTWRPKVAGVPSRYSGAETMHYLILIDDFLSDDEVMYVNVHPLARKNVYFGAFAHIREFPKEYETYEFLSCCDALVTDYSSVMFDFACTRKKIVLFDYDNHLYLRDRGLYLSLDDLPFVHEKTAEGLVEELRKPKTYDDSAFVETFCAHDSAGSTKRLCESIIAGGTSLSWSPIEGNGKENVLIYAGNLAQNGITTSLSALLRSVDLSKSNYFITFSTRSVTPNRNYLRTLPNEVSYIPRKGGKVLTLRERIVRYLYRKRMIPFSYYQRKMKGAYEAEFERNYGVYHFDSVIQFNGYDYETIVELAGFPGNKVIYVHNDMEMEHKTKGNVRLDVLKYAYSAYDKVAVVSEDILASTRSISGGKGDICVVPNCFDVEAVRRKAREEIAFDPDTESSMSEADLKSFLSDGQAIVNIGRFSPEKQHRLLLEAFDRVWRENQSLKLVIVGGVSKGNTYRETVAFASTLPCRNSIALIKKVSNPYPILNASRGLILSSKYEGFGLVLLEALALGKPIVSTDVQGPRGFMRSIGGKLVDNSLEGIVEGVEYLFTGDGAAEVHFDFGEYNRNAVAAFEVLI